MAGSGALQYCRRQLWPLFHFDVRGIEGHHSLKHQYDLHHLTAVDGAAGPDAGRTGGRTTTGNSRAFDGGNPVGDLSRRLAPTDRVTVFAGRCDLLHGNRVSCGLYVCDEIYATG